jgi:hypothetical protein
MAVTKVQLIIDIRFDPLAVACCMNPKSNCPACKESPVQPTGPRVRITLRISLLWTAAQLSHHHPVLPVSIPKSSRRAIPPLSLPLTKEPNIFILD